MTWFSSLFQQKLPQQIQSLRRNPEARRLNKLLFYFGAVVRFLFDSFGVEFTVRKFIGENGPYRLQSEFLFSDFSHWSSKHNRGFDRLVERAQGKECVFDVGAHIGLTVLPVSDAVDAKGKVFAFEPSARNRMFLEKHIRANKITNVRVIPAALGNIESTSRLFFEHDRASGMNSLIERKQEEKRRRVSVPLRTIDSFCLENDLSPDLIKIDVEGYEMDVLLGGRKILSECRPDILLSVHPRQLSLIGVEVNELAGWINGIGYIVRDPETMKPIEGSLQFGEYFLSCV